MKTIKIKTYKLNSTHDTNHFFLLSKGYNAGRPLDHPCPNCFIVTCDNLEQKGKIYWVCYSLWKSGAYLPLLCGSVIPFLHINDISAEIEKAIQKVNDKPKEFDESVNLLQQMMHTEKLLNLQIKLIAEIKASIAHKLVRK
jgi:hypothetical protein